MKKLWTVGLLLTIGGIGMTVVGLGISKYTKDSLYEDRKRNGEVIKVVENSYEIPNQLVIDVDTCDIKIIEETKKAQVTIQYPNDYEVSATKEKLSVQPLEGEVRQKTPWYRKFMWNGFISMKDDRSTNTIVVGIPKNYKGEIQIESNEGDISWENLDARINNLFITVAFGDVKLEHVQVKNKARLQIDSGDLKLYNLDVEKEIEIENMYGDISMNQIKANHILVSSDSGDIQMSGIHIDSLRMEMLYGDLALRDVKGKQLIVKSQSGDIATKSLDLNKISIEGEYGDISCKDLAGSYEDYKILTNTKYGDCNIDPKLEGKKVLEIRTNSGDINGSFTSK